jgi:hypothetical protein
MITGYALLSKPCDMPSSEVMISGECFVSSRHSMRESVLIPLPLSPKAYLLQHLTQLTQLTQRPFSGELLITILAVLPLLDLPFRYSLIVTAILTLAPGLLAALLLIRRLITDLLQKIKRYILADRRLQVANRDAFRIGVPCHVCTPDRQGCEEQLECFGGSSGRGLGDFPNVLVGLHYALDAGNGELGLDVHKKGGVDGRFFWFDWEWGRGRLDWLWRLLGHGYRGGGVRIVCRVVALLGVALSSCPSHIVVRIAGLGIVRLLEGWRDSRLSVGLIGLVI